MTAQLVIPALTAVFMLGMTWLRTRLHYSRSRGGPQRLTAAGGAFFVCVAVILAAGWWAAPPIGRAFSSPLWPTANAGATLARILWCLAVYYLAAVVHRALRAAGTVVFRPAGTL